MLKHCAVITAFKSPLYIDGICKKLLELGITSKLYHWDSIDDIQLFDVAINPVIIVADAFNCPAFMPNMIKDYLSKGGKVVTLGGLPFKNEFYSINNTEVDFFELSRRFCEGEFDKKVILELNPEEAISRFESEIRIDSEHNVIGFFAKAIDNSHTISIKLIDRDNNVFKSAISPDTSFKYFVLSKKDFYFEENSDSVYFDKENEPKPNFNNIVKIQLSHALLPAYSADCENCFFIDELSSGRISVLNDELISIFGLYPEYRFYPIKNSAYIKTVEGQAVVNEAEFSITDDIFSIAPLTLSTSFNMAKRFRFLPLIEVYNEKNLCCGYAAYMLLNHSYGEQCSEENGSSILAFTIGNDDFYLGNGADSVVEAISYMLSPVLLLEGGAERYSYPADCETATFGAVVLVKDDAEIENYSLKIQVNNISNIYKINELSTIKTAHGYEFKRISFTEPPQDCSVTVSLLHNDAVCDILKSDVLLERIEALE